MEEILVPLLQVFFEFFLEMLVYIGIDFISMNDDRGRPNGCVVFGLFALVGMAIGGVVCWFHPHPVLYFAWLRLTNLIVGPILAGVLSYFIARWRQRDGWSHFWMAFSFVLGYDLVRYAYAHF